MSDIPGSKASPGATTASPPIGYDPGRSAAMLELLREIYWHGETFERRNRIREILGPSVDDF